MKTSFRFLPYLLLALLISACAGRPRLRVGTEYPDSASLPSSSRPTGLSPSLEQLIQRIRQNGKDVEKYFILGENGQIIVMADLQSETGNYEVIYDLGSAKVLSDSAFEIPFLVREKESDIVAGDALVWRPGAGSAGLLLAMDDDYMEIWEQYFDLFDKYNAHLTFFVQGEYDPLVIGPFCEAALRRGHDIGFHSINHLDLRKVPEETFFDETTKPLEIFRQEGIPISSFAYPFGFSEQWMHETLLPSFSVLRGYGTTFRIYSEEQIRSGYIISRAIDNTVIQGDDNFYPLITLMLMTVKFLDDDRILPLTTHDISDSAHWGITPRRLEFLLKTADDLNLIFYRYCDF